MLLIIGRTASGKDTAASYLKSKGARVVLSYATRPKRFAEEDTHIFITPEEGTAIPQKQKVAWTKIGQFEYFATADQLAENDIYVIDPKGWKTLAERTDMPLDVLYIYTSAAERRRRFLEREEDKEQALEVFQTRERSENEQFAEFEEDLQNDRVTGQLFCVDGERPFAEVQKDLDKIWQIVQSI